MAMQNISANIFDFSWEGATAAWTVFAGLATAALWNLRESWRKWSLANRAGVVILLSLALAGLAGGLITLFPQSLQPYYWHSAIRWVLILVLTVLPGTIFYLFIATRSTSLLNSFVANLDRLGVLGWRVAAGSRVTYLSFRPPQSSSDDRVETNRSRNRRITSYFERFQASYGDLPAKFVDNIISGDAEALGVQPGERVVPGLLKSYFVPVYVATVLCALGWVMVLPPFAILPRATTWDALKPEFSNVTVAFLGAYLIAIQFLVWRFLRRDLGPNAYVAFYYKIIAAFIGAWIIPLAFALVDSGATQEAIWLTTFVIGGFPSTLWQVLTGAFKKMPGISITLPNLQKVLPVTELDGLTVWHEARLEEEDIDTAHAMATADIVDLLINTRFPPHRLIEWVDQAILLSRIAGPTPDITSLRRDGLRRFGIVNATAVFMALREKHIPDDTTIEIDKGVSVKLITWLSTLSDAIRTSPNIAFVQVWKNIEESAHPAIRLAA